MPKYTVLRPIAIGGRIDAGSVVELDEATANNYPEGFLQPVAEETVSPAASTDGGDASSQTGSDGQGSSTGSTGDQVKTDDGQGQQDGGSQTGTGDQTTGDQSGQDNSQGSSDASSQTGSDAGSSSQGQ